MISDESISLFMCNTSNMIDTKSTNYITIIKRIKS